MYGKKCGSPFINDAISLRLATCIIEILDKFCHKNQVCQNTMPKKIARLPQYRHWAAHNVGSTYNL